MPNDDYDPDGPGARRKYDDDGDPLPGGYHPEAGDDHSVETRNPYHSKWLDDD